MSEDARPRRSIRERIARELRRAARPRWRRAPSARPRLHLGVDDVEVHTLVCARDVPLSLWSLRSFVAFSGLRPRVVVHDDGSLTARHRRLYARHFHGTRVLQDRESAARMDRELAPWPACRRARQRPDFYCTRKLLDILFVAEGPSVLYIDSDVLFFREPEVLLAHVRAGTPCFGSDYQDAYGAPRAVLERWANHAVLPRMNAGLMHLPIAAYRERLPAIERYLAHAEHEGTAGNVNVHEQTAHALILSSLDAERLPPAYGIDQALDETTVSHHFVSDGAQRKRFWGEGVRRLRRTLPERLRRV